ncbi:MAG: Gfo/Idh/MocA family oxidoreductase [Lachnospiraceae bacterium]|nr:Gfo/Idh/MocA family oxidoreductase [Lachnospiraceae bacterium]
MMYRIAIVGAGAAAALHARAIQELDNAVLCAVCDSLPEAAERFANTWSCAPYTSPDELIRQEKPDVAILSVPVFLHGEYAERFAASGVHVLCEKPIEMDGERALRLIRARDEGGVKMMIGHVVRFWPGYAEIRDMMDRGELGDILSAVFSRASQVPARGGWILDPERGRGAIQDMLIHDTDFLHYLFGNVASVYTLAAKDDTGCYDHVTANLRFENGTIATALASFTLKDNAYPFTTRYRICGTKATLEYSYRAAVLDIQAGPQAEWFICRKGGQPEPLKIPQRNAYAVQLSYFLDCIREDRAPVLGSLESARESLQILDAIRASAESGAVTVPKQ